MQTEVAEFHKKYKFPTGVRLVEKPEGVDDFDTMFALSTASEILAEQSERIIPIARMAQERGDERLWRAHLLMEELSESLAALAASDEKGLADGITDLLYVVVGTFVAFDLPMEALFAEVHRANMTKPPRPVDDDGRRWYEPNTHVPDIAGILDQYRSSQV